MKLQLTVFTILLLGIQVLTSPVPHSKHSKDVQEKVLYDQRQEGDWNIRADLKNFVIVIIPKSSSQDTTPSPSLLDFFRRSQGKHHHVKPAKKNEVGAETMHFIESKTAPYHVDISKTGSHLLSDEILATQTPPASLNLKKIEENTPNQADTTLKSSPESAPALLRQLRSRRFTKAIVLTVPEEDFVLTKMEEDKKVVKKDGEKKKIKKKEEMMLLGAVEQCGPELYRDSEGVCRLRQGIDRNE